MSTLNRDSITHCGVPIDDAKILIVDDIPANLGLLSEFLEPEGFQISAATSGEVAIRIAQRDAPELILLDVMMPGMDGLVTCDRLQRIPETRGIPVIFITAKCESQDVIDGFEAGGVDYIIKPFNKEEVLMRVKTHLQISRLAHALIREKQALQLEIDRRQQAEDALQTADEKLSLLSERETERWGIAGFIGKSRVIQDILHDIRRLQNFATVSVLITGESGTGKELVARAIHFGSPRARGPFIPVNCGAIPGELIESSFFGHEKGAFTGATAARKGYFELAHGGTLFLDEIGDMPAMVQAKLLRVLEDGSVLPVGAAHSRKVDVRIVAATNSELGASIANQTFREDLFFRLAGFTVTVPSLRARKDDIPLLADHLLGLIAEEMSLRKPSISGEALAALCRHDYPGNVRELKNILERALIVSIGSQIDATHLSFGHAARTPSSESTPPNAGNGDPAVIQCLSRMTQHGESFWTAVHDPFLRRDLNRDQVRQIIKEGLEQSMDSYKKLLPLFGISPDEYRKFIDFVRHHDLKEDMNRGMDPRNEP